MTVAGKLFDYSKRLSHLEESITELAKEITEINKSPQEDVVYNIEANNAAITVIGSKIYLVILDNMLAVLHAQKQELIEEIFEYTRTVK